MTHHNALESKALMEGLYTNYKGAWGPQVKYKRDSQVKYKQAPESSVLRGSRKLKGRK